MNQRITTVEKWLLAAAAAVTAALLLPAVHRAAEESRRVACAQNLRQLYIGLMMYADDWDGWGLPGIVPGSGYAIVPLRDGGRWAAAYFPGGARGEDGRHNIFHCPSDPAGDKGWQAGGTTLRSSYRLLFGTGPYIYQPGHGNNHFHGWRSVALSRTSPPRAPNRSRGSNFMLVNRNFMGLTVTYTRPTDGRRRSSYAYTRMTAAEKPIAADLYQRGRSRGHGAHGRSTRFMHPGMGGLNVLCLDGSVQWRTDRQIHQQYMNTAAGGHAAWY